MSLLSNSLVWYVWAEASYRKFLQFLFHAQFCFWWFKTLLKVHLDVAEPVVKVLTLVCRRKEKSSVYSFKQDVVNLDR